MNELFNINLTPSSINAFKKKLIDNDTPNGYIRLGIKGSGGCSDFVFNMSFETTHTRIDKDDVFVFDDLKILIDKKSQVYLNNCAIEYEKNLMGESFKLVSENIVSTCGCGKSMVFK